MDDLQCCNFSMIGLFSSEMNANMFTFFCKVKKNANWILIHLSDSFESVQQYDLF